MIVFLTQQALYIVYDARRRVAFAMIPDLIGIFLILAVVFLFSPQNESEFATLRIGVAILALSIMLVCAKFFVGLSVVKFLETIVIPFMCALAMALCLHYMYFEFKSNILELLINTLVGALVYLTLFVGIMFLLWKVHPKNSLISYLPEKAHKVLRSI